MHTSTRSPSGARSAAARCREFAVLLFLLALSGAGISCRAGFQPYANVQSPERFREIDTLAMGPVVINSFGVAKGVAADSSSVPYAVLMRRLRASFTVLPVELDTATVRLGHLAPRDDARLRSLRELGADAVLLSEFRYVSGGGDHTIRVTLRVYDVADRTLLAESADEREIGMLVGGPALERVLRTAVELAVRRLEIHRPRGAGAL